MDFVMRSDISVLYQDGSVVRTLDPLVKSAAWSGDVATATRKLEVSLKNTVNGETPAVALKIGRKLTLIQNGKTLFIGTIFNTSISTDGDMTITAHDANIYLTKTSESRTFEPKTASQIIKELCVAFGIPFGYIADTQYVLPRRIFREKTLWDMMVTVLTDTTKKTGKRYYIASKNGKLEVYLRTEQMTQFVLEGGRTLLSASYSVSADDLRTQVKVVGGEEGSEISVTKRNDALAAQYGVMQHLETSQDAKTQAQLEQLAAQLLKTHGTLKDEASLEAMGITTVFAGSSVHVVDKMTGLSGKYYVITDSHSFEGGSHTMNITISKVDTLPQMNYEEPQASSTGGTGTALQQLIVKNLQKHGIPTWIGSAIIQVESNFNPRAVGDVAIGGSYGLLQLYTKGQGAGYSKETLFDPQRNLDIGLPYIASAYRKGVAKGLKGYELLKYTCGRSGHPSHNGTFTAGYLTLLKKSFNDGDELAKVTLPSANSSGSGSAKRTAPYLTNLPAVAVNGIKRTYKSDRAYELAKQYGLRITSGYRSPNHPLSRSNPRSDHIAGKAYDFAGSMSAMDKFADALMKEGGYKQVIWRNYDRVRKVNVPGHMDHVHVGFF